MKQCPLCSAPVSDWVEVEGVTIVACGHCVPSYDKRTVLVPAAAWRMMADAISKAATYPLKPDDYIVKP